MAIYWVCRLQLITMKSINCSSLSVTELWKCWFTVNAFSGAGRNAQMTPCDSGLQETLMSWCCHSPAPLYFLSHIHTGCVTLAQQPFLLGLWILRHSRPELRLPGEQLFLLSPTHLPGLSQKVWFFRAERVQGTFVCDVASRSSLFGPFCSL